MRQVQGAVQHSTGWEGEDPAVQHRYLSQHIGGCQ